MANWSPFYFGDAIERVIGDVDTCVYRPGDDLFGSLIRSDQRMDCWLGATTGDRVFFGRWGMIDEFLGADHPSARDKFNRRTPFFLGYSTAKGSSLPKHDDLKPLEEKIRADLAELWERASKARRVLKVPTDVPERQFADFGAASVGSNLWDQAVAKLERAKSSAAFLLRPGGMVEELELPSSLKAAERAAQPSFFLPQAPGAGSHLPRTIDRRTIVAVLAGIGLLSLFALYFSMQKKRSPDEREGREPTRSR